MQRNEAKIGFIRHLFSYILVPGAFIAIFFSIFQPSILKLFFKKASSLVRDAIYDVDEPVPTFDANYKDPFYIAVEEYKQLKKYKDSLDISFEYAIDEKVQEEKNRKVEAENKALAELEITLIKAHRKVDKARLNIAAESATKRMQTKQAALASSRSNDETLFVCGFKAGPTMLPDELRDQISGTILEGMPVKIRDVNNTGYFTRRNLLAKLHPVTNQLIIDADLIECPDQKEKVEAFVKYCTQIDFTDTSLHYKRSIVLQFLKVWKRKHALQPQDVNPALELKTVEPAALQPKGKVNFSDDKSSLRIFDRDKSFENISLLKPQEVRLKP